MIPVRVGVKVWLATGYTDKETIFSCYRLRSDRSLDDVGVELDTAVREEAFEDVTTLDRVP